MALPNIPVVYPETQVKALDPGLENLDIDAYIKGVELAQKQQLHPYNIEKTAASTDLLRAEAGKARVAAQLAPYQIQTEALNAQTAAIKAQTEAELGPLKAATDLMIAQTQAKKVQFEAGAAELKLKDDQRILDQKIGVNDTLSALQNGSIAEGILLAEQNQVALIGSAFDKDNPLAAGTKNTLITLPRATEEAIRRGELSPDWLPRAQRIAENYYRQADIATNIQRSQNTTPQGTTLEQPQADPRFSQPPAGAPNQVDPLAPLPQPAGAPPTNIAGQIANGTYAATPEDVARAQQQQQQGPISTQSQPQGAGGQQQRQEAAPGTPGYNVPNPPPRPSTVFTPGPGQPGVGVAQPGAAPATGGFGAPAAAPAPSSNVGVFKRRDQKFAAIKQRLTESRLALFPDRRNVTEAQLSAIDKETTDQALTILDSVNLSPKELESYENITNTANTYKNFATRMDRAFQQLDEWMKKTENSPGFEPGDDWKRWRQRAYQKVKTTEYAKVLAITAEIEAVGGALARIANRDYGGTGTSINSDTEQQDMKRLFIYPGSGLANMRSGLNLLKGKAEEANDVAAIVDGLRNEGETYSTAIEKAFQHRRLNPTITYDPTIKIPADQTGSGEEESLIIRDDKRETGEAFLQRILEGKTGGAGQDSRIPSSAATPTNAYSHPAINSYTPEGELNTVALRESVSSADPRQVPHKMKQANEAVVSRVIHQESRGDPNARAKPTDDNPKASASGLMQLIDGTGKRMWKELGFNETIGQYDPFNARANVAMGTRYLNEQLDRFDGDTRIALAAYTLGPGNIEKIYDRLENESGQTPTWDQVKTFLSPGDQKKSISYVSSVMGDGQLDSMPKTPVGMTYADVKATLPTPEAQQYAETNLTRRAKEDFSATLTATRVDQVQGTPFGDFAQALLDMVSPQTAQAENVEGDESVRQAALASDPDEESQSSTNAEEVEQFRRAMEADSGESGTPTTTRTTTQSDSPSAPSFPSLISSAEAQEPDSIATPTSSSPPSSNTALGNTGSIEPQRVVADQFVQVDPKKNYALQAMFMGASRTATFGGDLTAASHLLSLWTGQPYEDIYQHMKGLQDALYEKYPGYFIGGEAVGIIGPNILSGIKTVGGLALRGIQRAAGRTVAPAAVRATPVVRTAVQETIRGGKIGAGTGFAQGFNEAHPSEDSTFWEAVGERLEKGVIGGIAGGVGGAVVSGAVRGATSALKSKAVTTPVAAGIARVKGETIPSKQRLTAGQEEVSERLTGLTTPEMQSELAAELTGKNPNRVLGSTAPGVGNIEQLVKAQATVPEVSAGLQRASTKYFDNRNTVIREVVKENVPEFAIAEAAGTKPSRDLRAGLETRLGRRNDRIGEKLGEQASTKQLPPSSEDAHRAFAKLTVAKEAQIEAQRNAAASPLYEQAAAELPDLRTQPKATVVFQLETQTGPRTAPVNIPGQDKTFRGDGGQLYRELKNVPDRVPGIADPKFIDLVKRDPVLASAINSAQREVGGGVLPANSIEVLKQAKRNLAREASEPNGYAAGNAFAKLRDAMGNPKFGGNATLKEADRVYFEGSKKISGYANPLVQKIQKFAQIGKEADVNELPKRLLSWDKPTINQFLKQFTPEEQRTIKDSVLSHLNDQFADKKITGKIQKFPDLDKPQLVGRLEAIFGETGTRKILTDIAVEKKLQTTLEGLHKAEDPGKYLMSQPIGTLRNILNNLEPDELSNAKAAVGEHIMNVLENQKEVAPGQALSFPDLLSKQGREKMKIVLGDNAGDGLADRFKEEVQTSRLMGGIRQHGSATAPTQAEQQRQTAALVTRGIRAVLLPFVYDMRAIPSATVDMAAIFRQLPAGRKAAQEIADIVVNNPGMRIDFLKKDIANRLRKEKQAELIKPFHDAIDFIVAEGIPAARAGGQAYDASGDDKLYNKTYLDSRDRIRKKAK